MNPGKMAEYCLITAVLTASLFTFMFWGLWSVVIGAWVLMFPFAMLLGLIAGFVGNAMGLLIEYEDEDESEVWADETESLILEYSNETVGTFKDTAIHEWVTLKRPDTGEPIRLVYNTIVNNMDTFSTPEKVWFCIIPPGIMYTEPENADPAS